MSSLLSVDISTENSVTWVAVEGELDLSTVDDLRAALSPTFLPGAYVWLDLAKLSFMDSTGIHFLLEMDALARSNGHSFTIVRPARAVLRVLDLAGVTDHLPLAEELS
jgi:anti-sigma B factor antagonist